MELQPDDLNVSQPPISVLRLPSTAKKAVADIIAAFDTEHMRRLNMLLLSEFGNAVQPDTLFREFQADVNDLAAFFKGQGMPTGMAATSTGCSSPTRTVPRRSPPSSGFRRG
ncbi:MAG TPA: hypothetical protein VGF55_14860 [Gemmataceae bacterium]